MVVLCRVYGKRDSLCLESILCLWEVFNNTGVYLLEIVLNMAFRDRGFDNFSRSNRRGG